MPRAKLWSKDFVIVFVTFFFFALTFWLLMPTMAAYAVEHFHASQDRAGLIVGMFIVGALVSRLLAGRYIDRVSRRAMLHGSLLAYFLAMLLYLPADNLTLLLVVRFVHGVAFGTASTAMPTIVVDIIPIHRRGEGIGYFSLSPIIATAIGPLLGFAILQRADFRAIFVVCAVLSALSLLMALCARIPAATSSAPSDAAKGFAWHTLFERSAIPISIVMLLIGAAFSGVVTFLDSFATEIGLTGSGGWFFAVYAAFVFVSRPVAGRLLDMRGENIVMYPALLIFALGLALLAAAGSVSLLLLAAALVGLGFGIPYSCGQVIAVKEAPAQHLGRATATFLFCFDAGMGGGPFLIGSIIPLAGFRGTYAVLAGLVLVSVLLYDRTHGAKQRSRAADGDPTRRA